MGFLANDSFVSKFDLIFAVLSKMIFHYLVPIYPVILFVFDMKNFRIFARNVAV